MVGRSSIQVSGFPLETSKYTVKEFLEAHTGEGTVDDVKIREPKQIKPDSKLSAIVQFTRSIYAEHITSESDRERLKFGSNPLVAGDMKKDIVQKP